nr:EXS (ERD1/XPR1/SYG1) family protein [Tanacetum cinerariifolium]
MMLGKIIQKHPSLSRKYRFPDFDPSRLLILCNQSLIWQHSRCPNLKSVKEFYTILTDHTCSLQVTDKQYQSFSLKYNDRKSLPELFIYFRSARTMMKLRSDGIPSEANSPRTYMRRSFLLHSPFGRGDNSQKLLTKSRTRHVSSYNLVDEDYDEVEEPMVWKLPVENLSDNSRCQTVMDITVKNAFDNVSRFTSEQMNVIEKLWASVREQQTKRKHRRSLFGKLDCVRQFFKENNGIQLLNASRYFMTIIAVMVITAFELKMETTWKGLALVGSVAANYFNLYWDIVMDLVLT